MGEFPNKSTQFGSNKQPSDDSKGGLKAKTILRRIGDTPINEQYKPQTKKAQGLLAVYEKFLDGDQKAAEFVLDRTEGKVADEVRNVNVQLDKESAKAISGEFDDV